MGLIQLGGMKTSKKMNSETQPFFDALMNFINDDSYSDKEFQMTRFKNSAEKYKNTDIIIECFKGFKIVLLQKNPITHRYENNYNLYLVDYFKNKEYSNNNKLYEHINLFFDLMKTRIEAGIDESLLEEDIILIYSRNSSFILNGRIIKENKLEVIQQDIINKFKLLKF